jgi:homopolymeric O-antigen transport system permease protein
MEVLEPSAKTRTPITKAKPPENVPPLLPKEPLVTIESKSSWQVVDLRDVWAHRELLYFLIWRDVKIRYKQTLLGAGWAVIQPLLTMLIFTLIFNRVAGIESNGIPYPIFAYAALLPWTFFANSINHSSNSMVSNSHLITKVYFPRVIIPIAAVGAGLVDFAVAFAMFLLLMIYYRIQITTNLLMLPALLALTTLLAIGVGTWLSAINVKYRDVKFGVPFLVQIWMYLSPIAYPITVVPQRWRLIYSLNPVTGIIEGYRSAFFGTPFDWTPLGISLAITMIVIGYAAYEFRKLEKGFADII